MNGFGADPPTEFENISIVRAGGHFWGAQTFPAHLGASPPRRCSRASGSATSTSSTRRTRGIMFQTNYVGGQPQIPITDTIFTNISITGAQQER